MSDSYSVSLGATDDGFEAVMEAAGATAEESAGQVAAAWDSASSDVQAATEAAKESIRDLGATTAAPTVKLNDDEADADADAFKAKMDELGEESPTVDINVRGDEEADARLAAVKAGEDAVNDTHVNIDAGPATEGLEDVASAGKDTELTLENVRQKAIDAGVAFEDSSGRLHDASGQYTSAASLLEKLTSAGDDADTAMKKLASDSNSGGGSGWLDKLSSGLSGASQHVSWLVTAIVALGPVAAEAAAVAASAFAALPAVFAGLGAGVGVVMLAFSGVKTALSDASAAQSNAAATAQANAQAQNQQAQAAIQAAMSSEQEGQSATQAAQQVQAATQAVADAQTSAAASIHSALEQQQQAEESLAQSEYQEKQAQEALTQARIDAANQLTNLKDQMADGALAQQQATLDIATALQTLNQDKANPAVSQLQREQDQLTYDQALQHLQDLQDQNSQLGQQQAAAVAAGVDGAPAVVQAQNAVQQATQGVANASQSAQDAATASAQAQASGAEQIANAVQSLATANAAQAAQAQQAAQQQQLQALQTAAAGASTSTATTATQTYEQALAKLTPAGQQFVGFVQNTLKPLYASLQGEAETALLPGLQTALNGLVSSTPLMGVLSGAITTAGNGIAFFAQGLEKVLTSKTGVSELNTIFKEGAGFMDHIAAAAVDLLKGFLNIGSQAGPIVSAIGKGIEDLASDFDNWSSDGGFQKFLDYVEKNGPQVKDLLKDLAGLGGGLFKSFAADGPVFTTVAGAFIDFANALLKIPGFGPILVDLLAVGAITAKIGGPLVKLGETIGGLGKIAGGIGGGLKSAAEALGLIGPAGDVAAEGEGAAAGAATAADAAFAPWIVTIGIVVAAVAILAFAGYEIVTHWSAVEGFLKTVWGGIEGGAKAIFGAIETFFKKWGADLLIVFLPIVGIPLFFATHWHQVESDAKSIFNGIISFFKKWGPDALLAFLPIVGIPLYLATHWHQVETDAKNIFGDIIRFFDGIPDKILHAFTNPASMLLGVGKNIIEGLIHGLEGGAKDVLKAVKKVGSDIVDTFKSVLSIFSPSKVFDELANTGIMGGVVSGIENGTPAAVAAMQAASKQLTTVPFVAPVADLGAGGSSVPTAQQIALQLRDSGAIAPPPPPGPGAPPPAAASGQQQSGGLSMRDLIINAETNATASSIGREVSQALKTADV